jgi:hypothetical protein
MSYERTCDECIFDHPEHSCRQAPIPECGFSQRPATADELRAELLERAEALDGVTLDMEDEWWSYIRINGEWEPCVRRDGDEGIE